MHDRELEEARTQSRKPIPQALSGHLRGAIAEGPVGFNTPPEQRKSLSKGSSGSSSHLSSIDPTTSTSSKTLTLSHLQHQSPKTPRTSTLVVEASPVSAGTEEEELNRTIPQERDTILTFMPQVKNEREALSPKMPQPKGDDDSGHSPTYGESDGRKTSKTDPDVTFSTDIDVYDLGRTRLEPQDVAQKSVRTTEAHENKVKHETSVRRQYGSQRRGSLSSSFGSRGSQVPNQVQNSFGSRFCIVDTDASSRHSRQSTHSGQSRQSETYQPKHRFADVVKRIMVSEGKEIRDTNFSRSTQSQASSPPQPRRTFNWSTTRSTVNNELESSPERPQATVSFLSTCTRSRLETIPTEEIYGKGFSWESSQDSYKEFRVRRIWLESRVETPRMLRNTADGSDSVSRGKKILNLAFLSFLSDQSETSYFPLRPTSPFQLIWNLLGLLALLNDCIFLPLQVFDLPSTPFTHETSATAFVIYWTLDIPNNFLKGYYNTMGVLVLQIKKIWRKYLLGWFTLDVGLVALDWIVYIFNMKASGRENTNATTFAHGLRALRYIRAVRLLRLLKAAKIVYHLQDNLSSGTVFIQLGIFKAMLSIVMVTHFIACIWYGIGVHYSESEGWISRAGFESHNDSWEYRYTTSLHWALSQFGVGASNLEPGNTVERIVAILVLLFALIAFSSLVSSVVGAMNQLQHLRSDQMLNFLLLRRFCQRNNISRDLSQRVQRYLAYAYQQEQIKSSAPAMSLLSLLSESLRYELQLEIYTPHFARHRLFSRLCKFNKKAMMKVCYEALAWRGLASGDILFCEGEVAVGMFIILDGLLKYEHLDGTDLEVAEKQWVSEPVMWTAWEHLGDMKAMRECELVQIDAEMFAEVMQMYSKTFNILKSYAQEYVTQLSNLQVEHLTDIDDMLGQLRCKDLLRSMLGGTGSSNENDRRISNVASLLKSFGTFRVQSQRMTSLFARPIDLDENPTLPQRVFARLKRCLRIS